MTEIRCVNCGDLIECIEGVLWIHNWEEYFPGISRDRKIHKEFCLVDSYCAKNDVEPTAEVFNATVKATP